MIDIGVLEFDDDKSPPMLLSFVSVLTTINSDVSQISRDRA